MSTVIKQSQREASLNACLAKFSCMIKGGMTVRRAGKLLVS